MEERETKIMRIKQGERQLPAMVRCQRCVYIARL